MPSLLYFHKVYKFVEEAWKKPVTNILPLPWLDVARVSSETMSASNPTVINIVTYII
jgi:hypothetical protein